jgi:hypothetical protein
LSSTDNLTAKARFLKNASPRSYDEFLVALADYTKGVTDIMVMATDNWQNCQGHVQQCRKFLKAMEEAKNG